MITAQDILNGKKTPDIVTLVADASIYDAVRLMVQHKIGAIPVERDGVIKGIWTERDLLKEILIPGFDPKAACIGDHMQTNLVYAAHDTSLISLKEKFLGLFVRHILIKKKKEIIGILSVGDVIRASLLEKDAEIRQLNKIASWEYYENWSSGPKTKP